MRNQVFSSRFSDAPWLFKNNEKPLITVGGAGGISSWLLLFLSRTANYKNIYLYEDDIIDETNIAGQFFNKDQIGIQKSHAIKKNMFLFSEYDNIDCLGKFEKDSFVSNIVLNGFDNMKARKDMFESWIKNDDREILLDGRLIFEDGQIYCVTKGNEERYRETLFDDDDIKDGPCSMKATTHTGAYIASVMIAILNNYYTNTYSYKCNIREVPFSYIFSFAPLLTEINV